MQTPIEWLYPKSIKDAIHAQQIMARQVVDYDAFDTLQWIGGMDVSNFLFDPKKNIYACTVVLSREELKVIEQSAFREKQLFPYIPGLLGFREAPALIHAFQGLKQKPDLIMVDGHGICHPRGLGIASHIGVLLNIPTIGVAKSILVGEPVGELGNKAGSQIPIQWKGKIIGMLVRTKDRCNPLIVSIGHKISLATSVELVMQCCKRYRLPEPTRQAHIAANVARKNFVIKYIEIDENK